MAYRLPKLTWYSRRNDPPQSFNRFFDLPAELRMKIYSIYLGDGDLVLGWKNQPDLARASSQLRKEVLSMFEDQHVFVADLAVWPFPLPDSPRINVKMHDLLNNTSRARLSRFRYIKFTITINTTPRRRFGITVDLSKPAEEYCGFRIKIPKGEKGSAVFYKAGVKLVLSNMINIVIPQQDGWLGCMDVLRETEQMLNAVFTNRSDWERIASRMGGGDE